MIRKALPTIGRLVRDLRLQFSTPFALAARELFGDPKETKRALRGLRAGWGIQQMEAALGRNRMVLLVRQQTGASEHILAHRWRDHGTSNLTRLHDEAMRVYLQIRRSIPLTDVVMAGIMAPQLIFGLKDGATTLFPFVSFRHLAGPQTPLYYYSEMPHVVVAKWPQALAFEPERYLSPEVPRIDERWILGGIPSQFVVFRGNSNEVNAALKTFGSAEGFLQSLRTFTG